MRKILAILSLLLIVLIAFFYFSKRDNLVIKPIWQNPTREDQSGKELDFSKTSRISFNNHQYSYLYFIVPSPEKLFLIANFDQQKSTQKIKEENSCIAGINGGFYNEEDRPLGGFVSEGKIFKSPVSSALLNGFLWVNEERVGISEDFQENSSISLQSGPMLFYKGDLRNLSITNDEYTRRSIALMTTKQELIFMTIFDYRDLTVGPTLVDLPLIIDKIADREKLVVDSAINLDGGNASAIHTEDSVLMENTHVGSFFCLRK